MSDNFNPQSTDAMFATILARQKADSETMSTFMEGVMKRFDEGSTRMDAQDGVLGEIREQVMKTNGRVTTLEAKAKTRWKVLAAKAGGAAAILYGVLQVGLWMYDHGFRLVH